MVRVSALVSFLCLVSCGGIVDMGEAGGELGLGLGDDGVAGGPIEGKPTEDSKFVEEPPDCSGEFGEWEVLFEDEPGWISQALTPSSDGLEFFYARLAQDKSLDDSGTRLPTLRTRASVDAEFGEPTVLWDIAAACDNARAGTELAALDLSFDGKRLYLGCSSFEHVADSTGPLLMFERSEAGAPFDSPPSVAGEVGISVGLTRDELHAFGSSLDPAISSVLTYERASRSEPFGPAEIAPGAIALTNPEPSPDGFALWGVVPVEEGFGTQLGVAYYSVRTDTFDQPMRVGPPPPSGFSDVSPALSGDCREIYISRYTAVDRVSQVLIAQR